MYNNEVCRYDGIYNRSDTEFKTPLLSSVSNSMDKIMSSGLKG
jgi:hypothetical protein